MKSIEMWYAKSTKNTHVYSDSSDDAPVPTLYIKKDALPKKAPEKVTVTIEFDE